MEAEHCRDTAGRQRSPVGTGRNSIRQPFAVVGQIIPSLCIIGPGATRGKYPHEVQKAGAEERASSQLMTDPTLYSKFLIVLKPGELVFF